MFRKIALIAILETFALIVSAPAMCAVPHISHERVMSPEIGVEQTVAAGGELYSFANISSVEGAELVETAKAGYWLMQDTYEPGTRLIPVSSSASFKACVQGLATGILNPTGPCFLDDDGDGTFDRSAADSFSLATKLKSPARYNKIPIYAVSEDSFKTIILYQGGTADSLRFSYREFKNDMARPAFTEELTIPRETFPSMIMVKTLQVEILGVNGMGLRYRIIKIPFYGTGRP